MNAIQQSPHLHHIQQKAIHHMHAHLHQTIHLHHTFCAQNCYQMLQSRGYYVANALSNTLQGSIWNGVQTIHNRNGHFQQNIVIKVTNRRMHSNKISVVNGKSRHVEEDILSEKEILKYLTQRGAYYGLNQFIVNYVDFFSDQMNYYLVMQNGGSSLLDFVTNAHRCILAGKLCSYEWQTACKHIMEQIVAFLNIVHNMMNVCHLDISLENILINSDARISMDPTNNNILQMLPQFHIKFCDFGLSEIFDAKSNPNFFCNKFVGKIGYQSPEIYEKKTNFNAKAADIWSIGVCLFCMLFGCMPYRVPSIKDPAFEQIISGNVSGLIQEWRKKHSVINSVECLDILERIFTNENKRISAEELLSHPWLQSMSDDCCDE